MSEIDWSKAPYDATHYLPECEEWFECWVKEGHNWRVNHDNDWRINKLSETDERRSHLLIPRPPAWDGTGLPPVGTVCELSERVLLADEEDARWFDAGTMVEVGGSATFKGASGPVCAICVCGDHHTATVSETLLRPIRTPEQMAAEEREKAVAAIKAIADAAIYRGESAAAAVYDAGYRKVEGGGA